MEDYFDEDDLTEDGAESRDGGRRTKGEEERHPAAERGCLRKRLFKRMDTSAGLVVPPDYSI